MAIPPSNSSHWFVPHEESQTCSGDVHENPWIKKVIGVNVGGWLVLEPWITPSLFYQFLGKRTMGEVAMDSHSFCEVLGPLEANRQLRQHWATWVTEEHIARIASLGVNSLRLPVGDWMYAPYEPYIGCWDGAVEQVDLLLGWARKYDLKVLIDVHAVKGSANGLDNGGETKGIRVTGTLADVASEAVTFEHWPRRSAEWMGKFDKHSGTYPIIDRANIDASLAMLEAIALRHGHDDTVLGLEPVNEPWVFTPIEELKRYYWQGYLRVKRIAPTWRWVMHDSFRFDVKIWGGFMAGCPDIALDTHIYQAWFDPSTRDNYYSNACAQKNLINAMESAFGPTIVGEWSMATDNCAMWLNGFNDNLPGYPKLPCKFVPCAAPYMGDGQQPGAPPSKVKPLQGPFGTGVSGPVYGLCPIDRDWGEHSPANSFIMDQQRSCSDIEATAKVDHTDHVMRLLAAKKLQAFTEVAHGFFFWNFRTELEDQWSYLRAVDRGWIPHAARFTEVVSHACDEEDTRCMSRPDASYEEIRAGMAFCVGYDPAQLAQFDAISDGAELRDTADSLFDEYWIAHRGDDFYLSCDFNGAAALTANLLVCVARREDEVATRDGLDYVVSYDPDSVAKIATLFGFDLWDYADVTFSKYYEANAYTGATCDFGGAAQLMERDDLLTFLPGVNNSSPSSPPDDDAAAAAEASKSTVELAAVTPNALAKRALTGPAFALGVVFAAATLAVAAFVAPHAVARRRRNQPTERATLLYPPISNLAMTTRREAC